MASDFISQVGKGKPQGVVEALAGTGMFRAPKIAGDDDSGLFNAAAIKEWDAKNRTQTIVPEASAVVQPIASDPLAAIKAKDAAITAIRTVPTLAGITQDMVQKPVQAIAGPTAAPAPATAPSKGNFVAAGNASLISTPQAIAGMTPDNLQTVGKMMDTGLSANGVRRMDALNRKTIAGIGTSGNGLLDDKGRTYDEQVAHAQQVNAANALPTLSPRQASELAIANDPRRSRVTRANAAQGIAQFNSQLDNSKTLLGNQQAQTITGIKEQGDKYTADQHLAGVKYNADAHTKSAEIAGDAAVQKAQQLAQAKQQEQGQKDIKDRVGVLTKHIEGLNLSGADKGMAAEYARNQVLVEANPDKLFSLYGRAGRNGVALPAAYKPLYASYLEQARKQYPNESQAQEVAASHVYGRFQQDNDALVKAGKKGMQSFPLLNLSGIGAMPKAQAEVLG